MSFNRQLMIREYTCPIKVSAKAATAIFVGDSVVQTGSANAYVAESLAVTAVDWGSATAAVKQAAAKLVFLGISADQRSALQLSAGNILVHTSGVANVTVKDEAAVSAGILYTFQNGTGNTLSGNSYETTANRSCAIGKLVEDKPANQTNALIEIFGITKYIHSPTV